MLARQRKRQLWIRVASPIHRLLSFGRKPSTVASTRHILVDLDETAVVVIYLYTYIFTHIYIYIYIYIYICIFHSSVRLIVVSVYILCCQAGFQVLRDFSTPNCFFVCLCLIRVGVLARACAYTVMDDQ